MKVNIRELYQSINTKLALKDREEAASISYLILDEFFQLTRAQILTGTTIEVSSQEMEKLSDIISRIANHEPMQYVLGYADFCGRRFIVNPSVLIPRPETEELVAVVKTFLANQKSPTILDIGTGTGCIPISLKLDIQNADVYAADISNEALAVARQNAEALHAKVTFRNLDILNETIPFENLDVIVSNPPYIPVSEKSEMHPNVLNHEPDVALFVADDDPLVFYKAIVSKSRGVLKPGSLLAFEINYRFAQDIARLLTDAGFVNVEIIKDISGKDRIVKGVLRDGQI